MRHNWITLPIILLSLSACVSAYKGPLPDFEKTGPAAKQEIENFLFSESYWDQGIGFFQMEKSEKRHYTSSLMPVIEKVSPAAIEELKRDRAWNIAWWITYGASLGILIAELIDDDDEQSSGSMIAFYGLLGASVGINYYRISITQDAAIQYNRDLRAKYAPAVSFKQEF